MPRADRRAFTLIELLVVVPVIALLIAILLPSLARARESARRTVCLANVRNIGFAFHLYVQEHQYFPRAAPRSPHSWMAHDWTYWRDTATARLSSSPLLPYISGNVRSLGKIAVCPADDTSVRPNRNSADPPYVYSYTLNAYIGSVNANWGSPNTIRAATITNAPAQFAILVEEDERTMNDGAWDPNYDLLAIRHDSQRVLPDSSNPWSTNNPKRRGNAAFADGHGEYVSREMIQPRTNWQP